MSNGVELEVTAVGGNIKYFVATLTSALFFKGLFKYFMFPQLTEVLTDMT